VADEKKDAEMEGAAAEKRTRDFGDAAIAEDTGHARTLLTSWIGQMRQEARGLALQAKIAERVDGKVAERSKKLIADLERTRLSISESVEILAGLPAPSAPEVKP
jgi:hypothetical protein